MFRTTSAPLCTRRELLRAGLGTALGSWFALELLAEGRAGAATRVPPVPTPSPGAPPRRISMVGDSLTVGTMRYQTQDFAAAGWSQSAIDAYVSRGVRTKVRADTHTGITAVDAIRKDNGDTEAWIVGLGTNDAVIYSKSKHAAVIAEMMDHIGRGHRVMWINIYLPDKRHVQDSWNAALEEMARNRDDMSVLDWAGIIAGNKRWMAKDGLHCSPTGYQQRSLVVGEASKVL
ncbi:MAG TPA: GDSL-type esterase/lipase family protein, partial [Ilumatobacteraceae bacterium]|nr:GDSL-type esterase/lipase family protein [Ilumatobacteraceae bacterium]